MDLPCVSSTITSITRIIKRYLVRKLIYLSSLKCVVERGYVSPKHSVNTMVKNIVDIVAGGIMFWMFGYGVAFGKDGNSFIGGGNFFFDPSKAQPYKQTYLYINWIFHFAFASTAITIVSGSIAGRMKMSGYIAWAFIAPLFYSLVAHWQWSEEGWLSKMGFADFAGCGPVHIFGACGSLAGIIVVGPRIGRFNDDGKRGKDTLEIYEPDSVILGTLILWWGWIGFNCGSTFGIIGIKSAIAVRVGVCTMVAAVSGAATELLKIFLPNISENLASRATVRSSRISIIGTPVNFVSLIGVEDNRIKVVELTNGILSSLVSITACCNCVNPRSAIIIGAIAPSVASFANKKVEEWRLDDPCGAVGVHGACGIWGLIALALFKQNSLPGGNVGDNKDGLFYSGSFRQLGVQLLGILCITCTGFLSSFAIFMLIKMRMRGTLRVAEHDELVGLDQTDHDTSNLITVLMSKPRNNMTDLLVEDVEDNEMARNPITRMPNRVQFNEEANSSNTDESGVQNSSDAQNSGEIELGDI